MTVKPNQKIVKPYVKNCIDVHNDGASCIKTFNCHVNQRKCIYSDSNNVPHTLIFHLD